MECLHTHYKFCYNLFMEEDHFSKRLKISNEYIRGLVEGEGCFTFCTNSDGRKVPTFCIAMHIRDSDLIYAICNRLRLPNKIYVFGPYRKDGANRSQCTRLMVREYDSLKNIIIPFFYKKLYGHRGRQFELWLEKIGTNPMVSPKFKQIYDLYKIGYYDNFPGQKFWEQREHNNEII